VPPEARRSPQRIRVQNDGSPPYLKSIRGLPASVPRNDRPVPATRDVPPNPPRWSRTRLRSSARAARIGFHRLSGPPASPSRRPADRPIGHSARVRARPGSPARADRAPAGASPRAGPFLRPARRPPLHHHLPRPVDLGKGPDGVRDLGWSARDLVFRPERCARPGNCSPGSAASCSRSAPS
jgi:hypothetical protein